MFDFEYHKEQFSRLCSKLGKYTGQCIIYFSARSVENNIKRHDPKGELLIGQVGDNDKITVRNVKTNCSTGF